jgi:hypothetical protein
MRRLNERASRDFVLPQFQQSVKTTDISFIYYLSLGPLLLLMKPKRFSREGRGGNEQKLALEGGEKNHRHCSM